MIRCVSFVALLMYSTSISFAQDSLFPDKSLEAAVRAQVYAKRHNQEPLTKEEVAKISTINGTGKGIANLAGIEHCVAVQQVDLGRNEIVDLTPMAGLKLIQSLTLKNNKIQSIEPLKEFVKLQYVDLAGNQIQDLTPLAKATNLQFLDVAENAVEDVQVVKQFPKLHALYLKRNPVKDWTPIGEIRMLSNLDLSDCKLSDVSFLKPLKRLSSVILFDNQIRDLTPLLEMAKADESRQFSQFWRLYLKGNPIDKDADQVRQLKELGGRLIFE